MTKEPDKRKKKPLLSFSVFVVDYAPFLVISQRLLQCRDAEMKGLGEKQQV